MPDNQPTRQSYFKSVLARKLILYILLFSLLVTVLGASFQLFLDYKNDLEHLHYVVDQIETSQLPSVITSVWVADQTEIGIKLQQILSLPDIQYLEIRTAHGELVTSAGVQQPENIIAKRFPLHHTFRGQEVDLGDLYVEANLAGIRQEMGSKILIRLLTMGVEIFLVVLFIFLIFYFLIGRDLKLLADYTSNLDSENLELPLRLKRSGTQHQPDELDLVAASINKMRANLLLEIDKLKKAEAKIAEGKAEFAAIFNAIKDALVFVDLQRRIIMVNPAFTTIFDYQFAEIAGQTTEFLYATPEAYKEQGQVRYNQDAENREPFYENEYRRKDGTVFTGETLGVKVRNKDGEVIGFLGVIRDITEKKRTLAEKAGLEANLRQAYKMEAIGTLAGGIAHDFNNILGIILGYAEIAKDDAPPNSPMVNDLEKVIEAGNRAKNLVQQILAFSRQESIERFPLQLQSLVEEMLKMLRASIPTTIEIQDDIDSRCGVVLADPTQVHQILMNLCTNASQAMAESGGILKVELKSVCIDQGDQQLALNLEPGEYVKLIVSDTGPGIGPDVLDKIFDPYFTTKGVGKGTGMGLAIVHGIITNYGGSITAESELGKGATFNVYFPVVGQNELALEENDKEIPRGKGRVLYVDDEELLTRMGRDMLERLGYTVTVRQSSLEALATFKDSPEDFDVIVTDQTMPDLTGSDLARLVLEIRPDIPIILCTGYSNLIDEATAKNLGIKEFAMKPLTKGVLARLLNKVLNPS